jgi:hypothetical protein
MTDTSPPAGPAPMEGRGVYNRCSAVQAAGYAPALPLLAEATLRVPLPPVSQPAVIADYGSSEGRNSLVPIAAAIRALRARGGADRAISVVHTDLPANDFSGLFQALETDPESYLLEDPATFAFAVGRSFYRQILPAGSVTLGWSAWAVQWLSRTPCTIPDQIQVAYSRDPAAKAAFARQAEEDWRTFLTHRASELCPGGRLVILTIALTETGGFGYRAVLEAMNESLRELVASGVVQAEEAARMAIPTVGRSRADLLAPFGPEGRFAGLTVEHVELFLGEDLIWRDYERDRDAAAYGARWAAFSRASVLPTLALDLADDQARRDSFVSRMEAGMARMLAERPEPAIIPLAMMTVAKDADA